MTILMEIIGVEMSVKTTDYLEDDEYPWDDDSPGTGSKLSDRADFEASRIKELFDADSVIVMVTKRFKSDRRTQRPTTYYTISESGNTLANYGIARRYIKQKENGFGDSFE